MKNKQNFILMEPSNQSFKNMMGNGTKYQVPRFQRDYSWEIEALEDLWGDIDSLGEDEFHYMGYLVLRKIDKNSFEIIDGQQRLSTITLMILIAMKKLKSFMKNKEDEEKNKQRFDILNNTYIGAKDPISLSVDGKLSLNRNNQFNYKYISSHLKIKNERMITKTNKLLNDTFNFFDKKSFGNSGLDIMKFVEKVTDNLIFTKIVVEDAVNAFKVFETLNARGVQLSTSDLLKNYIFSKIAQTEDVSDNELDELDEKWASIIEQLGESNFTDFLRYYHNAHYKVITKKNLFKSTRENIKNSKDAYLYIEQIEIFAPIYYALGNPNDEFWSHQDNIYKDAKPYLKALRLFNIKQPLVVLMMAFEYIIPLEFVKIAEYIYKFSMRYNVICHSSAKELEYMYSKLSLRIFNKDITRASHIKNSKEFKTLYPSDNMVQNIFEFYKMPSRSNSIKIRFILSEIEKYLGGDSDYTISSLEHICPYNPTEQWIESFGEGVNNIQDRIGNLVLLKKDLLKRQSYEEKKIAYKKENTHLLNMIIEYDQWNQDNLNHYQKRLAEIIIKVWDIKYREPLAKEIYK